MVLVALGFLACWPRKLGSCHVPGRVVGLVDVVVAAVLVLVLMVMIVRDYTILYSWYQKCLRMPRWSTKSIIPADTIDDLSLSCQARLLTLQWSAVRIPAHRWSPFLTRCQGIFLCSAMQATPVHMQKAPSDAATEFREITPKISQNQSLPLSLHVCTVWQVLGGATSSSDQLVSFLYKNNLLVYRCRLKEQAHATGILSVDSHF